jgi:hypothetical protein
MNARRIFNGICAVTLFGGVAVLFTSCGSAEAKGPHLPPAEVTELTGWVETGNRSEIASFLVDGQPCIVARLGVESIAISCNWDTQVVAP